MLVLRRTWRALDPKGPVWHKDTRDHGRDTFEFPGAERHTDMTCSRASPALQAELGGRSHAPGSGRRFQAFGESR